MGVNNSAQQRLIYLSLAANVSSIPIKGSTGSSVIIVILAVCLSDLCMSRGQRPPNRPPVCHTALVQYGSALVSRRSGSTWQVLLLKVSFLRTSLATIRLLLHPSPAWPLSSTAPPVTRAHPIRPQTNHHSHADSQTL